jgi:hypothetical protein
MEKRNHPVDDLFRDVMRGHTLRPSDGAREAFLREAATVAPSRKPGKKWFLLTVIGIIVIMGGNGIYLGLNSGKKNPVSLRKETSSPTGTRAASSNVQKISPATSQDISNTRGNTASLSTVNSSSLNSSSIQTTKPVTSVKENSHKNQRIQNITEPIKAEEVQNPVHPADDEPVQVTSQPASPSSSTSAISAQSTSPTPVVAAVNNQELDSVETIVKNISPESEIDKQQETPTTRDKTKENPSYKKWNISAGIYYTPEWMFNIIEGDKFVNSFGAEGVFRFGNYSVRTGVGLSITKGTNELLIGYNDYLGSFRKLDSASFKWNPQHSGLVPTFYLSEKDVYDSLVKIASAKIIKRYTYLQVPLILGYDFLRNEKFSLGLRAGPILSVLLETKQLTGEYDPGKNRVVSMNQIAPERIQTNWQLSGGINVSVNLSKNIELDLEPEVRYYFNSVYEKPGLNKKPWSAGIRVAFHFIR